MSKAKKIISELKDYYQPARKLYRGDIYKIKCHSCGRTIPVEYIEWMPIGASDDPYRPFCPICAKKQ